jgi:PAS domain S-box-containing protein
LRLSAALVSNGLSDTGEAEATSGRAAGAEVRKGWPLRAYFAVLVGIFVIVAAGAVLLVRVQTERAARTAALTDARYAANTAAKRLGGEVALLRTTLANVVANKQIVKTIRSPVGCTLTYATDGAADRSHIELLRSNGDSVCSSRARVNGAPLSGYAGQTWLLKARAKPLLVAPFADTSGVPVVLASVPVPGHGIVAGFMDLRVIGPNLASLYGGGHHAEFLIATADGQSVLARSLRPQHSIGASLAGTPFAHSDRGAERPDLDGKTRYYASSLVTGTGWRLYVGEDKSAALAGASRLAGSGLLIALGSLTLVLIGVLLVYRRIAEPIKELSAAVRSRNLERRSLARTRSGPVEVTLLAEALDGFIASVERDLLERRRAEAQVQALAAIVESSGDAIIGKTPDGTLTSWNAGAERMYGYTRDEAVGQPISFLVLPQHQEELQSILEGLKRGEPINGFETERLHKDGSILRVSLTISPIHGENGTIIGASTIARDVTAQRRAEEELRQSQKMEAIGSLASGVAHDFNNILMVIRTCGALLLNRVDDESLRKDVVLIDEAAQRAAQLTQQLLAFGRQQVLRPELTSLNSAAEETLRLLHRLIGEDILIECDLASDLEAVVADRGQLVQVILNLAVNAREAMPSGGVLTIRTANSDVDATFAAKHSIPVGHYAMLHVADSGCGMDRQTAERIFDPFFTTKETGTGLGLATVYGIVKQSNGHISLDSQPGMGTTFRVYFPSSTLPVTPPAESEDDPALHGAETILLVEDEEVVRPMVARALRAYGYTVLEAQDGPTAIRIMKESGADVDLLLTDVVMPGMNGRELAEHLLRERPSLNVLYTSGYPADTIIRHGITEKNTPFLEKPYLPNDLAKKIREVMDAVNNSRDSLAATRRGM